MSRHSRFHASASIVFTLCTGIACLFGGAATAQEGDRTQLREEVRKEARERIFGSRLMTPQERNEYRSRMRELRTHREREEFRREHHARMLERARERGLQLADEPPAGGGPRQGSRLGAGPGNGSGAGPGGPSGKGR